MDHDIRNGVLVLGSTGFIGAHLVDRLAGLGYHVYALARSETNSECAKVRRIQGSIDDEALLRKLIGRCRHIVHVASLTTPSASTSAPLLEINGNLTALAQLLSLARDFPDRRMLYMSSAGAVYGDLAVDADESLSRRPRSYYGAGKAAAEMFIHACTMTTTWQAVVLRPSNIYGPGQHAASGFAIVPTLFARAAEGTRFTIWGDGQTVRDYCHVSDLVDLTVKALEHEGGTKFSVYNAASGEATSILELVAACEHSAGRRIDIEFQPARSVDVPHVSLNTNSARTTFGWKAEIPLCEGLDQTWRWFLQSNGRDPRTNRE
ncbi:MAG: NAD-dependent epimerase/dehydratase family protein [Steroidobacteraceae bacterium]